MSNNLHLMAWVSRDTKDRFAALARLQNTSESALLKRMVEAALGRASPTTVLTAPDSIAWLLNIRGSDVPHTPLALGWGSQGYLDTVQQPSELEQLTGLPVLGTVYRS